MKELTFDARPYDEMVLLLPWCTYTRNLTVGACSARFNLHFIASLP